MAYLRTYSKALDFEIEYLSIGTFRNDEAKDFVVLHDNAANISRWAAISVYEDMFTNFLTCEIAVMDQDNFLLNRLRTDETILLKFKTPDLGSKSFEERTHYFYLYKIDKVMIEQKPQAAAFIIKGISFEYFYSSLRTFSKAYKGKTNEIVSDIYKEYILQKNSTYVGDRRSRTVNKQLFFGRPTKHDMKFTFPYVNPMDAINHLASVSIDSVNPDICNYIFFENKDGFHFTSITELIENPKRIHNYSTKIPMDVPFTFFDYYFDKTIVVRPKRTGDKIIDTLDGVYGEFFAEYDLLYKSYTPFVNNSFQSKNTYGKRYLDYFPKTKHLNKYPLLSKENLVFKNPLGRNRVCFTNDALYSEEVDVSRTQKEWKLFSTHEGEYSFQRRSMMQQINAFSIEVMVPGNSNITVGDCVDLNTFVYKTEDKDKYLSGRYLVTGVNHLITLSNYVCMLTLSRDSITSVEFDDDTSANEG